MHVNWLVLVASIPSLQGSGLLDGKLHSSPAIHAEHVPAKSSECSPAVQGIIG